jgi:hypothetical protein
VAVIEAVPKKVKHPPPGGAVAIVAQPKAKRVLGSALKLDDDLDVDLVVGWTIFRAAVVHAEQA